MISQPPFHWMKTRSVFSAVKSTLCSPGDDLRSYLGYRLHALNLKFISKLIQFRFCQNLLFFPLTYALLSAACFPRFCFFGRLLFRTFFPAPTWNTAGNWRFLFGWRSIFLLWKFARKVAWTCFRNFRKKIPRKLRFFNQKVSRKF